MRYLLLCLVAVVSACATGVGNRTLQLDTRSGGRPVAGATCLVNFGREGLTVTTPATLSTGNAQGDLQVVCNKPGYRTSELYYRRAQSGGYGGSNVGVGLGGGSGGVGVGVGLNFPLQLGGRSDYPPSLTIDLTPL
jgi:hypothetical protein